MKTLKLNWFGFIAARADTAREPRRWARIIELVSRGSIPGSGCDAPEEKPARARRPEPVRWGNFR
jgi:hypothetical protein